jgi:beta-glucosidase/6-phospho-beta-glucosidase/beta-galactosidase
MTPAFMFATGIENSAPTINQGRTRVDEMAKCGHYRHWREDFDLVEELGIRFLRYGPPLHRTHQAPDRYDWSFADETFNDLRRRDLVPIADLCHFGVPDWLGNFQNPDFPKLFAAYARAFARRFPWVQLYTPVNEMYVCATFSARYGWWNEQLSSDRTFVNALKHIVRANVLAMQAILDVRPDAIFIQSESSEYFHADNPQAIKPAEIMNAERFLSLDLNYGRRVDSEMYEYLMDNGMTREEYHFFLHNRLKHHCIMGNDYYILNRARVAMKRSIGCGRSGRTSCACATTAFRSSASRGTRSRIKLIGTRPCAKRTIGSTRLGFTISNARSGRSAGLTRS